MKAHGPSMAERIKTAAEAKRARLEKVRAVDPTKDPEFAARLAARQELAAARDQREAQRREERRLEKERQIAAAAAAKAAQLEAERAAAEAREREQRELAEREAATELERKKARDARYAARKARQR